MHAHLIRYRNLTMAAIVPATEPLMTPEGYTRMTKDATAPVVEVEEEIFSAERALTIIATQLTRLNDNLEKLMVKSDPYSERFQVPVVAALDAGAFQKLQQLTRRG